MTSIVTVSSASLASDSLLVATSTSSLSDDSQQSDRLPRLPRAAIAGVVFCGVFIALLTLVAAGFCLYLRRRRRHAEAGSLDWSTASPSEISDAEKTFQASPDKVEHQKRVSGVQAVTSRCS